MLAEGVEDGEFDAVVGGDAADVELGDSFFLEIVGETGAVAMAVVVEAAVAVDGGIGAFAKDGVDAPGVEAGGEVGSAGSLHTVGGPEHLREACEFDGVADFFAGMVAGEAAVIGGVPILGGDDVVVVGEKFVDEGHEFVASGDAEGAAGEEVVLEVDDEECFHERMLDGEVESGFRLFFVGFAVEAVEAGGAVGDVLFDLVGLFEDFEFEQFFAEVAFVEGLAEDALVEALQLGEGEFAGKEFESDGGVAEFGANAFLGGGEDFGVVEGEVGEVIEGKPSGLVGVGGGGGRVFAEVDEGVVRDGDDVLAGVALGLAEAVKLLEVDLFEAGFFFEFASGAGFEVFADAHEAAGESPLALEGGEASLDEEDFEIILVEPEDHAVGGEGGAGVFVGVHAPTLVFIRH